MHQVKIHQITKTYRSDTVLFANPIRRILHF